MRDSFSTYHPIVSFTYFAFVLGFSMFITHPISQAISLVCALCYAVQISGRKAIFFTLKFALPTMLLTAVINPAFNHAGITILCYLPTGNPLTLESILFGLSSGALLANVLIWFISFNSVFTSDKFIYLFGRVIPSLSLVLSMTLRFIPRFKAQMQIVTDAQRCIGRDVSEGSIFKRTKIAITILSIMITWSLENAIETADSMKSRGYGLANRTAFSIYRFDDRDRSMLAWILCCGIFVLCGTVSNGLSFRYFPSINMIATTPLTVAFQMIYFALGITPFCTNRREARKWMSLH